MRGNVACVHLMLLHEGCLTERWVFVRYSATSGYSNQSVIIWLTQGLQCPTTTNTSHESQILQFIGLEVQSHRPTTAGRRNTTLIGTSTRDLDAIVLRRNQLLRHRGTVNAGNRLRHRQEQLSGIAQHASASCWRWISPPECSQSQSKRVQQPHVRFVATGYSPTVARCRRIQLMLSCGQSRTRTCRTTSITSTRKHLAFYVTADNCISANCIRSGSGAAVRRTLSNNQAATQCRLVRSYIPSANT